MAKLKAVIQSLDDVEEPYRALYTEQDGKYVLGEVEGLTEHPAVKGLQANRDQVLREKKALQDRLAALEGIDPDEYRRLKEAAEKAEEDRLASRGQFEALRKKLEDAHAAALRAKDEEIRRLREEEIGRRDRILHRLAFEQKLDAGLADPDVDVLPELRPAVKAMLRERAKVRVELTDSDDAVAYVSTDMGETDVATFVKAWAATEEAKHFRRARQGPGSGASPSTMAGAPSGPNPFKRETRNLTEQMRIARENPELARRLAAQAGVKLDL